MAAAGFFRLYSPPQSCPQTTFLRTEVQGPAVKAGHLDLLPPNPAAGSGLSFARCGTGILTGGVGCGLDY